MFSDIYAFSPVSQDFMWIAEYADGTRLPEFSFLDKKESSFYDIQRKKLLQFGLIGHGMKFFFEVFGGIFKINGKMIELVYRTPEKDFYLTGQNILYNDIIQYKDASSVISDGLAKPIDAIHQFNFGYKVTLEIAGVSFFFKPIWKIPFGFPTYLSAHLVASENLDGKLLIQRNGITALEIPAPLRKNVAGECNWIFK